MKTKRQETSRQESQEPLAHQSIQIAGIHHLLYFCIFCIFVFLYFCIFIFAFLYFCIFVCRGGIFCESEARTIIGFL